MADLSYHRGTRLTESNENPVIVKFGRSGVVTVLGTAPAADAEKFPLNMPVMVQGGSDDASGLGIDGTLADAVDDVRDQQAAYIIAIRIDEGVDFSATISNLVGDADQKTGVHALKRVKTLFGFDVGTVVMPGFTVGPDKLPTAAVQELKGLLHELEADAFVTGPCTNITDALAYESALGGGRITQIAQMCLVWDTENNDWVARPACARFAGVEARIARELGPWHSVSNKDIYGIGGVEPDITYSSESNLFNENGISVIVNHGSGFVTWGGRMSGADDLWVFRPVRKTADLINKAILKAFLEFVDRPFSAANVKMMLESGNAAMRTFMAEGAIIGGKVWLDERLNEPTQLASGRITLSLDFEPPAPMEDIRFIAHRNIEYYLEVTKQAMQAAA